MATENYIMVNGARFNLHPHEMRLALAAMNVGLDGYEGEDDGLANLLWAMLRDMEDQATRA